MRTYRCLAAPLPPPSPHRLPPPGPPLFQPTFNGQLTCFYLAEAAATTCPFAYNMLSFLRLKPIRGVLLLLLFGCSVAPLCLCAEQPEASCPAALPTSRSTTTTAHTCAAAMQPSTVRKVPEGRCFFALHFAAVLAWTPLHLPLQSLQVQPFLRPSPHVCPAAGALKISKPTWWLEVRVLLFMGLRQLIVYGVKQGVKTAHSY